MRRRIYVPADYAKPTLLQRLTPVILGLLGFTAFYALIMIVLIEWVGGCGEIIYYPDHTWETGDCGLVPVRFRQGSGIHGKWRQCVLCRLCVVRHYGSHNTVNLRTV